MKKRRLRLRNSRRSLMTRRQLQRIARLRLPPSAINTQNWLECALLLLSLCALILVMTSCDAVPIKDVEACADAGALGASCFHSLSDKTRDLTPPQWAEVRYGWLCMSTDDWTNWKQAIETLCQNNRGECSYEDQQRISQFFLRLRRARQRIAEAPSSGE